MASDLIKLAPLLSNMQSYTNTLNNFSIAMKPANVSLLTTQKTSSFNDLSVVKNKVIEKRGPLIGYRGWNLDKRFNLKAVSMRTRWNKGIFESMCYHTINHKIDKHCSCGIYGYWEPAWSQVQGEIRGSIKIWGTVIPGEYGFRAEKAQIQSLFWPYCSFCAKSKRDVLATWKRRYSDSAWCCDEHKKNMVNLGEWHEAEEIFKILGDKYEVEIVKPFL